MERIPTYIRFILGFNIIRYIVAHNFAVNFRESKLTPSVGRREKKRRAFSNFQHRYANSFNAKA